MQCTLHSFNLTHYRVPSFDALSYEWGSKKPKDIQFSRDNAIYISHCGSDKRPRFPVRENLFLALKKMRSDRKIRVLWIDAICVDQGNIKERSHQVGLVRMIYGTATMVLVWLGPEDKEYDAPFDLLNRINNELKEIHRRERRECRGIQVRHLEARERFRMNNKVLRESRRGETWDEKLWDSISFYVPGAPVSFLPWRAAPGIELGTKAENEKGAIGVEEDVSAASGNRKIGESMAAWRTDFETLQQSGHEWQSLRALLNRTYWTRIWIVQEFLLPRAITLHCGCESISSDDYIEGLHHVRNFEPVIRNVPEKYFEKLINLWETVIGDIERVNNSVGAKMALMRQKVVAGGKHQLLELFEATKESRCYDPRDRVFALLGLASDVRQNAIEVDYKKPAYAVQDDVMMFFRSQPLHGAGRGLDLTYISSLLYGMLHKH